jgi:cell wall assembly regulator SMI1
MNFFKRFWKKAETPTNTPFLPRHEHRTAAPVAESWKRLESWYGAHLPELLALLRPGCSPEELASFEKEFRLALPDDVKASFLIHDGQQLHTSPGAIAGQPFDSLDRIRHNFGFWRELCADAEQADHVLLESQYDTSFPIDAIQCENATPYWIPLGDWDGNCYGIDLNPGPNGVVGQVINFGRDEENKYVLALTWAHFLEDIADEFEAGHLVPMADENGRVDSIGRPGHQDQALFNFYREWSEAKLPTAFQSAKPIPRKPAQEGFAIDDEVAKEAAALVFNFITAMHEYEMKWLALRPIHELGYKLVIESGSGVRAEPFMNGPRVADITGLKLRSYTEAGIADKKQIYEKFATSRTRAMGEAFIQSYPVTYDPQRDRVSEVRQVSSDRLIVVTEAVDGWSTRYHLVRDGQEWKIDLKDMTQDFVKFEKFSL